MSQADNSHGELFLHAASLSLASLRRVLPDPFVFHFLAQNNLLQQQQPPHSASILSVTSEHDTHVSGSLSDHLHSQSLLSGQSVIAISSASSPPIFPVGQFQSILIAVTNRCVYPLSLSLIIRPYQETVHGGVETNLVVLSSRLMWVGPLVRSLPMVCPCVFHNSTRLFGFSLTVCVPDCFFLRLHHFRRISTNLPCAVFHQDVFIFKLGANYMFLRSSNRRSLILLMNRTKRRKGGHRSRGRSEDNISWMNLFTRVVW